MSNSNNNNIANSLFEDKVPITYDDCPIVLIDCSGSTVGRIFVYENDAICTILNNRGITKGHLMYWSSGNEYRVINEVVEFTSGKQLIDKHTVGLNFSRTDIEPALNRIPTMWYHNDNKTDIYIVTDGEICDNPSNKLKEIMSLHNVNITIITVCAGKNNYLISNVNAGGRIFDCLRNSKLLAHMREFMCINDYHKPDNPYCNLFNPELLEGLVPFRQQYFRIDRLNIFIDYISNIIDTFDVNSENYEVQLNRLSYDLIVTLKHLTHGASPVIKNHMIMLFSQLFIDTPLEINIGNRFRGEANNDNVMTCTFEEYRDKRAKLFDRGYEDITTSLKNNVTNNYQHTFHTFPLKTNDGDYVIIQVNNGQVCKPVTLGMATYENAGFKIDNYVFPVLPAEKHNYHLYKYMCLRQWIRANYSQIYNISAPDDTLMYLFMGDILKVYLKTDDDKIRSSLSALLKVMLSRARYGSGGMLETTYLLKGNPPCPVTSTPDKMPNILQDVINRLEFSNIKPFTLWYGMMVATGDKDLIKCQYQYCKNDINNDFPDVNINFDNDMSFSYFMDRFASVFDHKVTILDYKRQTSSFDVDLDYTCILTLDDTTDTGGWGIKPHKLSSRVTCNPRFVISEEGFLNMKQNTSHPKCPLCRTNITYENSFCKVLSKKEEDEIKLNEEKNQLSFDYQLNNRYHNLYSSDRHNMVITKDMISYYKNKNTLIPIDTLDFEPNFLKDTDVTNIRHKMNGTVINVMTTQKFVREMYPFLNQISYDNLAIAGGFCRSILLNQPVNDIDFFFYDLDELQAQKRINTLVNELIDNINKQHDNMVYTFLHKPKFNVVEMLCFQNIGKKTISNEVMSAYKNIIECQHKLASYYKYLKMMENEEEISDIWKQHHKNHYCTLRGFALNNNGHYMNIDDIRVLETYANIKHDDMISNIKYDITYENIEKYGKDLTKLLNKITMNIELKYKIQIIVRPNSTMESIMHDFDMPACKVLFDGKTVYMTESSHFAYKYMYNYLDLDNYSDFYYKRLVKYFDNGFNILAPDDDARLMNKNNPTFIAVSDDSDDDARIMNGPTMNDDSDDDIDEYVNVMVNNTERRKKLSKDNKSIQLWDNLLVDNGKLIDNITIITDKLVLINNDGTIINTDGMYGSLSDGMYNSMTNDLGNYAFKDDDTENVDEPTLITQQLKNLLLTIIRIEMLDNESVDIYTTSENKIDIEKYFDVKLHDKIKHR